MAVSSNVEFFGDGPATRLICTSALNGSDANRFNDVFNANNLTVPFGSYQWGLTWRDMTIDCTLQNASGVPHGQSLGTNLCAIECQNVDAVQFKRLRIRGRTAIFSTRLSRDSISSTALL